MTVTTSTDHSSTQTRLWRVLTLLLLLVGLMGSLVLLISGAG